MALTIKSELKTAITNWLGRTDLTDRYDEFIVLAEQDIERNLRKKVVREPLTLDSAAVDLPAACAELRSVRYDDDTRKYSLRAVSEVALADLRQAGSGVPHYFAVVDNVLLLDITPDDDFTAEIVYFEGLTPLGADSSTNDVLTDSPDIYLYACLKEAELYLEHDERNPLWSAKYQKAVQDENNAREQAELGMAPMHVRLPIVFG